MIYVREFEGAKKSQIIDVVRRSLSYIDIRLIEHGDRVAYIAEKIASMDDTLDVDREKLLVLCLLHDIGAYKTEEIDDMVGFETGDVMAHAAYGYVFLRNTTALGDVAEAILYHHTNYDVLKTLDTPWKTMAELIFLADRIDILLAQPGSTDLRSLYALSGSVFSPRLIELFFRAQECCDVIGHIRDLSYALDVAAHINALGMSRKETGSFLEMLVYSIDFRSPFTVTHTANTTAISGMLSDLLGLDESQRNSVILGAFLHDIGKIGIPYAILEKPGRLDDEQMRIMRTHVGISDEILRDIVPDDVCEIAIRHHEKCNGTGYPRGMRAEELTLAQRIVAVADIFSALISRRSYKEAFPKDACVAVLMRMRDAGELCSQAVNALLEHYDEIMDEIARADDPVIRLYESIREQYEQIMSRN